MWRSHIFGAQGAVQHPEAELKLSWRAKEGRMRGTKQNVTDCPQTAKEAIIAWHLEGTIGQWNASAEQLYGYLADEIIGQSVSRLLPVDDLDELTLIAERIDEGKRSKRETTGQALLSQTVFYR
jgi:PAS domain S-box-containing protein